MHHTKPTASISAAGPQLGRLIELHMERAFRKVLHGPHAQHQPGFVRLLTRQPHPFGNFAFIAELDDVETTQRAIEPLCSCGAPAAALYPGNPAPNVADQLRAHGFELHEPMPAMAVDIDRLTPTRLPPGYELVRISDRADAKPWTQAFADGYELPYPVAEAFSPAGAAMDLRRRSAATKPPSLQGRGRVEQHEPSIPTRSEPSARMPRRNDLSADCELDSPEGIAMDLPEGAGMDPSPDAAVQFFAVRKDGRFVSTSMLFLDNGLAGVYCVSTIPHERGKGLGAHATAEPLRQVYDLGYRVGILQSSPAGYKVYQQLGFTDFGAVPIYLCA